MSAGGFGGGAPSSEGDRFGGPAPLRRELPPLGALRAAPPSSSGHLAPLNQSRLRPLGGAGGGDSELRAQHLARDRLRPLSLDDGGGASRPQARLDFGSTPVRPPPRYGDDQPPRQDERGWQRDSQRDSLDGSGSAAFRPPHEFADQQPQHIEPAPPRPYTDELDYRAAHSVASTQRSTNQDTGRTNLDGEREYPPHLQQQQQRQEYDESDGYAQPAAPGQLQVPKTPVADSRPGSSAGRMPLTPTPRAIFSPHAIKNPHMSGSASNSQLETKRAAPAIPPMAGIEELLSPAALQCYIPFFARLGYTDLDTIISMDDDKTDWMLDEVEAEAEHGGIMMKGGHKNHIVTRIKQERIKRRHAEARRTGAARPLSPAHAILGAGAQPSGGMNAADVQPATGNVVLAAGMKGLLRHWCCCLGLCLLLIVVSVAFLILYQQFGQSDASSGGSGVNSSGSRSTSSGGWQFLYIVSIIGFVMGGLALLFAALGYARNPAQRSCASCTGLLPNCKKLSCPSCKDCCEGCGGACGDCSCLSACGLGGCCASLKAGFSECTLEIREACHLPECPEMDCGECCACTSCKQCAHECGCADLTDCCGTDDCGCKDCCSSCETPGCPECDCACDCCPDCEGGVSACCGTLYKVCCCQCKIQVS